MQTILSILLIFHLQTQVLSLSFSIPFIFNSTTNFWIKVPTTFHPIYEQEHYRPLSLTMTVDINLHQSFIIHSSSSFQRTCFKVISEANGSYDNAMLTGKQSESKVSFHLGGIPLYWENFPMIYITKYTSLPFWKEVLGLGHGSYFQRYISQYFSSSKFALDFKQKQIFGGRKLEEIISTYSNQIGYCSFPLESYGGSTHGWRCNLEYVIIKKDKYIYSQDEITLSDDGLGTVQHVYLNESDVYTENTMVVNNRFETVEGAIKAPKEFMLFLENKYFKNKNCKLHNLDGKFFYICDEMSYYKCSDMTFVFGEFGLTVKKEKLFYSIGSSYVFLIGENKKFKQYKWVFGNLFLKNFITVFDTDEDKMRFIPKDYKEGGRIHKIKIKKGFSQRYLNGVMIKKGSVYGVSGICLLFCVFLMWIKRLDLAVGEEKNK